MEKKFKLGVIGAGFMASAIINGAIQSGFLSSNDVFVSDINIDSLKKLSDKGISVTTDNAEVFNSAEYVLLAVKPQNFQSAVSGIGEMSCTKVISIMAGVKKDTVKSTLNKKGLKVVRCMPNTPCSVGSGAVGIDIKDFDCEQDQTFVKNLFSSFAKIAFLDESKLNAVTGISGSSPAYFYLFIKCLTDAGVKYGLDEDDAKNLAVNTMIGSGKMILKNSDKSLDELIAAVCSKGGTTLEAIKVFNERNLHGITDAAVEACVRRAEELENTI